MFIGGFLLTHFKKTEIIKSKTEFLTLQKKHFNVTYFFTFKFFHFLINLNNYVH